MFLECMQTTQVLSVTLHNKLHCHTYSTHTARQEQLDSQGQFRQAHRGNTFFKAPQINYNLRKINRSTTE